MHMKDVKDEVLEHQHVDIRDNAYANRESQRARENI